MEDVLELYSHAEDRYCPVVCFDERPIQLIGEVREPVAAAPGRRRRYDYQYRREGTANLFIFFCPRQGWRHVEVTERRTSQDFAVQMRDLVDNYFPNALTIRLVLDNLNIHRPASLYQTFEASEARRILRRLEFHYTPIHASWLNMVELELAVLSRQCLNRRLDSAERVRHQVWAWEAQRNRQHATVDWRFTCQHARQHLRLYPS